MCIGPVIIYMCYHKVLCRGFHDLVVRAQTFEIYIRPEVAQLNRSDINAVLPLYIQLVRSLAAERLESALSEI